MKGRTAVRKRWRTSKQDFVRLCLLPLLLLLLSACGGKQEPEETGALGLPGQETQEQAQGDDSWIPEGREWVYLPESVLVEDASASYQGKILENTYYYVYDEEPPSEVKEKLGVGAVRIQELRFCRYDLTTKKLEKMSPSLDVGDDRWGLSYPMLCKNGNWWSHGYRMQDDDPKPWYYVLLFDPDGNCLYCEERTELRELGISNTFLGMGVDDQGRMYEFGVDKILLWDADGTPSGSIPHDAWQGYYVSLPPITAKNGNLIVLFRWGGNGYSVFSDGMLVEIDFEQKNLKILAEGPEWREMNGLGEAPKTLAGKTDFYDFVCYDQTSVYGYSLSEHKKEELFTWKECNITGNEIWCVGTLQGDRLYAVINDYGSTDHRIAMFTEVPREEAPPMITMTLATVGKVSQDLNAAAMRYNRYHFPYRVEVKSYETVTDLYNALLAGERIDLLDLSQVNVSVLTGQKLLEDLAPYLERSESGYHREDFVEGILDAYTVDGILVGIPDSFTIRTVAGDLSRYGAAGGDKKAGGLTLDAFLLAAEKDPDAKPLEAFDGLTKEELMQYLMLFNLEEFVDWEKGECHFDSALFKRVLELLKNFPEAAKNEYAEISLPTRLQKGDILSVVADMNSLTAIDLYQAIFEKEDVLIGFPTPSGTAGHLLITEGAFGILTTSKHKEAAWNFLESVINHRIKFGASKNITQWRIGYNRNWKIYPTLQKNLDDFIEDQLERYRESEAMGVQHGSIELYGEDWTFETRHLSREELEAGPRLAKDAIPYFDMTGDAIIRIISEEAPAYYSGQKSLDAVAEIIQNRARLYVIENR